MRGRGRTRASTSASSSTGGRQWLRDWRERQRYTDPASDEVETVYRNDEVGVRVSVRSVAGDGIDALSQRVEVRTLPGAPARPSALVAFENLNLVVSNIPSAFLQDWCFEELNTDRASWSPAADAIVHEKSGTDLSSGRPSSVAVALGFGSRSSGHQIGGDAVEPAAARAPDSGRTRTPRSMPPTAG